MNANGGTECPNSPDGYHYTNFPRNGLCRYCGSSFGADDSKFMMWRFARVVV